MVTGHLVPPNGSIFTTFGLAQNLPLGPRAGGADRIDEAAFVLGFIEQSFYGLTGGDSDSSESS